MRHFESLEDKLSTMMAAQRKREVDLEEVVRAGRKGEINEEVEKWKKVVESKNKQVSILVIDIWN